MWKVHTVSLKDLEQKLNELEASGFKIHSVMPVVKMRH